MNTDGERGSVILLTAVLIPVLIFIVGLGVDIGIMYAVRNKAQNAADAAALAGAYACHLDSGACLGNSDAQTAGNQAAQANPIFGQAVTPNSVQPYLCTDSYGTQNYCVKVQLSTNSPVYFAKVFGKQPFPINVQATAQTNTGFGFSVNCVKPIFIPDLVPPSNTPIAQLTPGTLLPDIRPTDPCNGNKGCTQLTPSTYYSLDYSSLLAPPNDPNAVEPVVFSDGTADTNGGDKLYRDTWQQCMVNAIRCGQQVRVQTGETGNPTAIAVQNLINGGGTTIYAPVWDASQAVVNGNNFYATVVGFAKVSDLQCINGKNKSACGNSSQIQATFQQYLSCNTPSLTVNAGSFETRVRLVNPNLTNSD